MRWTSAVVLVSTLGSTLVVLPTVTLPAAAARPVPAEVEAVPLRGIDARGLAESPVPEVEEGGEVVHGRLAAEAVERRVQDDDRSPLAVTGRVQTGSFSAVGVTWRLDRAVDDISVQVRTRAAGRWTDWTEVEVQASEAVDADGAEGSSAAGVRAGSDPLFVGPSDAVQVRVDAGPVKPRDLQLQLVDPGRSPADASVGETGVPRSTAGAAEPMPAYVPRAQWGADERLRTCTPSYSSTIRGGILHTTATGNDYTQAQSAAVMRSMYAYHTKSLRWCDIGYNFLVDKFGTLYEGRWGGVDRPVIGAHTGGFNTDTFGVSMIGNHDLVAPTGALLETVRKVFAWKLGLYGLDPTGTTTYTSAGGSSTFHKKGALVTVGVISGHRDYSSKSCPGNFAYPMLPALRAAVAERIRASLGTSAMPTTVALTSAPSTTRYGSSTTLRGRLTTASGQPLAGKAVQLTMRRPGGAWTRLSTRSTAADGTFSGTHTPLTNLEYTARYAGDSTSLPAERRARVAVATVVTAALSRPTAGVKAQVDLRGTVRPAHAGQRVQRQQLVGGRWTTLATAVLSQTGAYRFTLTTGSRGAKTYRVVKPSDPDHTWSASAPTVLTVR